MRTHATLTTRHHAIDQPGRTQRASPQTAGQSDYWVCVMCPDDDDDVNESVDAHQNADNDLSNVWIFNDEFVVGCELNFLSALNATENERAQIVCGNLCAYAIVWAKIYVCKFHVVKVTRIVRTRRTEEPKVMCVRIIWSYKRMCVCACASCWWVSRSIHIRICIQTQALA